LPSRRLRKSVTVTNKHVTANFAPDAIELVRVCFRAPLRWSPRFLPSINTGPHTGFRMPDAAAAGGGVCSLVSRGADSVDELRPPGFESSAVTGDRWLGELGGCEL
jgi:hypothetical protein